MEMPLRRSRSLVAVALLAAVGLTAQFALGRKKDKTADAALRMNQQRRAVHALNRLTFGPRPGDVERVIAMGVDKWIDLELHPETIDDSALETRLAPFRTLRMGTSEIVENFPPNQLIKQIADGKASLPRDPTQRAVYETQLQRYEDKQERKIESAKTVKVSDEQNPLTCRDGACPVSADSAEADDRDQMQRRA